MKTRLFILLPVMFFLLVAGSCDNRQENTTALDEQARTEMNQKDLNSLQPPAKISPELTPILSMKPALASGMLQKSRLV
jgi:hypothetical protein